MLTEKYLSKYNLLEKPDANGNDVDRCRQWPAHVCLNNFRKC